MSSAGEPNRSDPPVQPAWSAEWRGDDEQSRAAARTAPGGVRDVTFDPPAAAVALLDAARRLSSLDPAILSPDQRLGVFNALEATDRILTAATMGHLVAVDDRAELDIRFGMTPAA